MSKPMTKTQLVAALADEMGSDKKTATAALRAAKGKVLSRLTFLIHIKTTKAISAAKSTALIALSFEPLNTRSVKSIVNPVTASGRFIIKRVFRRDYLR